MLIYGTRTCTYTKTDIPIISENCLKNRRPIFYQFIRRNLNVILRNYQLNAKIVSRCLLPRLNPQHAWDRSNACGDLVGKPEGKGPLEMH
jgi:hypothetical protein